VISPIAIGLNSPAEAQTASETPADLPDFADIVEKVKPAVAGVKRPGRRQDNGPSRADLLGSKIPPTRRLTGRKTGHTGSLAPIAGSGFFISADGI